MQFTIGPGRGPVWKPCLYNLNHHWICWTTWQPGLWRVGRRSRLLVSVKEHLFPACGLAANVPHLGSGQLGENLSALASWQMDAPWPCHNLSATVSLLAGKTRRLHKSSAHYHSTAISINTGMSSLVCLCPKSCGGRDSSVGPAWRIPNVCGVRGQEHCGSPGKSSFAVHYVHQTAMERSSIHVSS